MKYAWNVPTALLLLAAGSPSAADGLKERVVLPAHEEWVYCLAFAPDGKTVATGGRQHNRQTGQSAGELKLWDVDTGKQRAVMYGHTSEIRVLAFAPDGKALATGTTDNAIKVWDVETAKEALSVRTAEFGAYGLGFSPDGKTLGYAGHLAVRLVDAATGRELASFRRRGRDGTPIFSSDFKTFVAPNHQDADLYDIVTGKVRLVLEDHRGSVSRLAFSADGKTLAVASYRSEYPKYFGEI